MSWSLNHLPELVIADSKLVLQSFWHDCCKLSNFMGIDFQGGLNICFPKSIPSSKKSFRINPFYLIFFKFSLAVQNSVTKECTRLERHKWMVLPSPIQSMDLQGGKTECAVTLANLRPLFSSKIFLCLPIKQRQPPFVIFSLTICVF